MGRNRNSFAEIESHYKKKELCAWKGRTRDSSICDSKRQKNVY